MITLLIGTVLGSLVNRIRGGGVLNLSSNSHWVAVAVMALVVFLVSWSWLAALVVGGAYLLGENFGWTKWIGCAPLTLTQEEYNKRWLADKTGYEGPAHIAKLFADEKTDYKTYCFVGMAARGAVWWVPVFAALWWFGLATWSEALLVVPALSLAFPVTYWLAYRMEWIPTLGGRDAYISRSEILYGALYGAALGLVLGV
jgi:hypothetical protein